MIVLENNDVLEGDSTNALEVDFTIHGLDNNALKQLADGQLPATKGTLYTADSTDVITSIIFVNTGAAYNYVNLYIKPSSGTSRRLIPKDLKLESGYSLHFNGAKVMVLNTSGQIVYVGATGPTGADGTNGSAATIAIGTVTSGTPAAVTNIGTPTAAILDFTLVTGATGAQGPSGTIPIASAGGTVNAITANYTPDLTLSDLMLCAFIASGANTITNPTFAPDGLTAHTIVKKGGTALAVGDISSAGAVCLLVYNLSNTRWELLNPAGLGGTLAEGSPILLPVSLTDSTYVAVDAEVGTLGETVAFGEIVYLKTANSKWWKAKADVAATSGPVRVGVCVVAGNADAVTIIIFIGKIRADSLFDTFAISGPVFISAATAGKIVSVAPTGTTNFVVRIVGHAIDGNTVHVNVSPGYIELA